MTAPVTSQDFSGVRWRGHWVWVPEEQITPGSPLAVGRLEPGKESHGLFRKAIHLESVPERAPTRITADSRYALYANGQEVFRGPIRSQPRRLYYDLFDLAPYLRRGENILAIYVKYYGTPKSFWMPAVPNMILGKTGVMVIEANLGDAGWLISDSTWKARKAEAWSDDWREMAGGESEVSGVPIEVFDARRFPHGWKEAGFDDRDWGQAQMVPAMHIGGFAHTQPPTDPYGPLYPRPIARLGGAVRTPATVRVETLEGRVDTATGSPVKRVEATVKMSVSRAVEGRTRVPAAERQGGTERPGFPASAREGLPINVEVPADGTARLTLDMERIVSGLVRFEIEAPAGTVLDISYVEEPVTGPSTFLSAQAGTRYVARGENDLFEVFDSNGFRYAYILAHGVQGAVSLKSFWVQEHLYPWQGGADFTCDDEELNRIYRAGIRTVQLNSHDAFIDCPTREQRAWVGDGVVHQMVNLATNLDWRLAWHYLTLGNSPRSDGILPMSVVGDIESGGGITIPDWSLHWVHGVYNLYRFDGARETVKAFLPTIERVLRWYTPYQTADGVLKDVVEWDLVDWSSVMVEDTSSLLTALWARGLREFAEMAGWLEESSSRRWAEGLYERARAGFEVFWDETRGSYADHVVDGMRRPEMSQLAGALAIVSGLAPRERWGGIVDTTTDPARLVVRSWTGGSEGEYSLEKMERQFRGIYETDWAAEWEIVIAEPFLSYIVHDAVALAGRADMLPDLYRRWSEFLEGGYDTIGECWGWGTHVHGWSCTPTRDMIFYTLGVTPAEPGYAKARIAPRLGRLAWARGSVPTPHGLVSVEVKDGQVTVDSPVPVVLELEGSSLTTLPAGRHQISV